MRLNVLMKFFIERCQKKIISRTFGYLYFSDVSNKFLQVSLHQIFNIIFFETFYFFISNYVSTNWNSLKNNEI